MESDHNRPVLSTIYKPAPIVKAENSVVRATIAASNFRVVVHAAGR